MPQKAVEGAKSIVRPRRLLNRLEWELISSMVVRSGRRVVSEPGTRSRAIRRGTHVSKLLFGFSLPHLLLGSRVARKSLSFRLRCAFWIDRNLLFSLATNASCPLSY